MNDPKSPWAAPTPAAPAKNPWTPAATFEPLIRKDVETYEREGGSAHTFRTEMIPLLDELKLDSGDAATLSRLVAEYALKPASDEQIADWEREQSGDFGLRYAYGKDLAARQAAVRRYLDGRPQLRKTLQGTGLSSHPKVVKMLLNRAMALPRK